MAGRQKYDSEFKRAAVELAQTSGKTMAELEVELGISKGLLEALGASGEAGWEGGG